MGSANLNHAKKDYFTKNPSSPTFFGINTLNFQEMFLAILEKFLLQGTYKK